MDEIKIDELTPRDITSGDYVIVYNDDEVAAGVIHASNFATQTNVTEISGRIDTIESEVENLEGVVANINSQLLEKPNYDNAVLNLDAKYFTPIDNGSGGLALTGISVEEIQEDFDFYQKGVRTITTNKSGFLGLYVINFNVNANTISFQYRFGIADYSTGIVTIYTALISAIIGGGIATPVQVEFRFEIPGVGELDAIKGYFPAKLQSPADDSQVIRTSTDVQINAHKLTWNGAGYTTSDENIIVPSANPTEAGAYPADHYNKVQLLPLAVQSQIVDSDSIITNTVTSQVDLNVASSDVILTIDAAGVKANIRMVSEGSDIVLYGSGDNELGRVSIARGVVTSGYYDPETQDIVLELLDGSEVRVPASDLVDEYTAGEYLNLSSLNEFSVNYNEIKDQLLVDGFQDSPADLTGYLPLTGSTNLSGTFSPANNSTGTLGTSASRWGSVFASAYYVYSNIFPYNRVPANIGASTNPFTNGYFTTLYVNGIEVNSKLESIEERLTALEQKI